MTDILYIEIKRRAMPITEDQWGQVVANDPDLEPVDFLPGRNPKTGEPIILKSRRKVTFHCSPRLKEKINLEEDV